MIYREARLDDVPAIARVHVDTWQTAYRGILPENYLANLSYEKREKNWVQMLSEVVENDYFIYVSENQSGEIVAFANGGPERAGDQIYKGEVYAIYVLEDYQRQGIGRQLISAVAERLADSGFDSMLIWVLADNPACRFYEALGGQKVHEKLIGIGDITLNEFAYGWANLAVF